MIWWAVSNGLVTILLLLLVWAGVSHFNRCWHVLHIFGKGFTWCKVVGLDGKVVEGWVSVIHLKSISSHLYQECPMFKVKTEKEWVTISPGNFQSIREILGLHKIAWKGGRVGLDV